MRVSYKACGPARVGPADDKAAEYSSCTCTYLCVCVCCMQQVDNSSLTGESEPQERNAEIVDPANSEHGHGGFGTTGTTDNEKTVVHVRQPGKAVTPAIEATNLMVGEKHSSRTCHAEEPS